MSCYARSTKKQTQLADEVHSCHEAGPYGFVLHRQMAAPGGHNLAVRPRNWDGYARKVKTDRRDALALLLCLDWYLTGNDEAVTAIRVPGETEGPSRSATRQRARLPVERQWLAGQRRRRASTPPT